MNPVLWYLEYMENEIAYMVFVVWICTIGILTKIALEGKQK